MSRMESFHSHLVFLLSFARLDGHENLQLFVVSLLSSLIYNDARLARKEPTVLIYSPLSSFTKNKLVKYPVQLPTQCKQTTSDIFAILGAFSYCTSRKQSTWSDFHIILGYKKIKYNTFPLDDILEKKATLVFIKNSSPIQAILM